MLTEPEQTGSTWITLQPQICTVEKSCNLCSAYFARRQGLHALAIPSSEEGVACGMVQWLRATSLNIPPDFPKPYPLQGPVKLQRVCDSLQHLLWKAALVYGGSTVAIMRGRIGCAQTVREYSNDSQ